MISRKQQIIEIIDIWNTKIIRNDNMRLCYYSFSNTALKAIYVKDLPDLIAQLNNIRNTGITIEEVERLLLLK